MTIEILEIDQTSEWWPKLLAVLKEYQPGSNASWLTSKKKNFISSHTIIVVDNGEIIAFMRFCVRQLTEHAGQMLIEATGEALGVKPKRRNQGIGRMLQEYCEIKAQQLGCYQFRSFLSDKAEVLRHIKLTNNYGIYPFPDNAGMIHYIKVL